MQAMVQGGPCDEQQRHCTGGLTVRATTEMGVLGLCSSEDLGSWRPL